jgi:hypothetical protein
MFRRLLVLGAVVGLALTLAASALAASVTVRVEGKTRSIFGSLPIRVDAANALQALEAASVLGEFYYGVTASSFGDYVSQVGRYPASGSAGWVFKVNGVSPPVGADKVELKEGDSVLWYWATFGDAGGPPTLDLRASGRNCYTVTSVDDGGRASPSGSAVLHVDGRRVRTSNGRGCVGRHVGTVRAYAVGAVRSNAVK